MEAKTVIHQVLVLVVCLQRISCQTAPYSIGVGIADVTGPSAGVPFMGYAHPDQIGKGIHTRLFARAFIIDDGDQRVAFVSVDCGMMGQGVRMEVASRLNAIYGDLYTVKNVVLSGTHSHSGPGGFMQYVLTSISTLGYNEDTFEAMVTGIVRCIRRAHDSIQPGRIYFSSGQLIGANINRSPTAYLANPVEERARYDNDVDKDVSQLKFVAVDGTPLGILNWFAVHATSMNNTNKLVSGDNKGLAEMLFEEAMNPGALPGKGRFVAAFASSNLGDVSPNTAGPHCLDTGLPCDVPTSTCDGRNQLCVASGPGIDMYDSTYIIGEKQFQKALELFNEPSPEEITGPVRFIHQFVNMANQSILVEDPLTSEVKELRGCSPAMGYSFAAGTTDGPGAFNFSQGTITGNEFWDNVSSILKEPTEEQIECHRGKPILLDTGEINFPYDWQPKIVDTQILMIGNMVIMAVPGEFTTMSGRRARDKIRGKIILNGGPNNTHVVIAGLSGTYSHYITTPEEYTIQRYEGASTIYGPDTLDIYISLYSDLAEALMQRIEVPAGPDPPYLTDNQLNFLPDSGADHSPIGSSFGDCVSFPSQEIFHPGDEISAIFVSGNPRSNPLAMLENTFLEVQRLENSGNWTTVATDASWETRFIWNHTSIVLGTSEAEVVWQIPVTVIPGIHQITHYGYRKDGNDTVAFYSGSCPQFTVEQ